MKPLPAAVFSAVKRKEFYRVTPWQGWQDSNLRLQESKSCALPLGHIPMSVRVGSTSGRRSRTIDLAESNRAHLRAAGPASLEPPTGIEPAHPAWEAGVLPLNYGGIYCPTGIAPGPVPAEPLLQAAAYLQKEGRVGFEPTSR